MMNGNNIYDILQGMDENERGRTFGLFFDRTSMKDIVEFYGIDKELFTNEDYDEILEKAMNTIELQGLNDEFHDSVNQIVIGVIRKMFGDEVVEKEM